MKQLKSIFANYYLARTRFKYRNTVGFSKKLKDLPVEFVHDFDEKAYLEANEDVSNWISSGEFKDPFEHFVMKGSDEIKSGERVLYPNDIKISEKQYIESFIDVKDAIQNGVIKSGFYHYLLYGYKEIKKGLRKVDKSSVYQYYEPELSTDIKNEISGFKRKPKISILVPVYNVEPEWLHLAIDSVHEQWYENWQLCLVDDASTNAETLNFLQQIDDPKIKVTFLERNHNISLASNEGLKQCDGEYVALLDHDDELTKDALYEVVKAINAVGAEFIYSDEDKLDEDGKYCEPNFKPDFLPDNFLSTNYLSHLGVIKKALIDAVGGFSAGVEGAQDYDLYLKVLEQTNKIHHIPKVLYHWRKIPGSTAATFADKSYANEAGRLALLNAMQRRGIDASVVYGASAGLYRCKFRISGSPLVTIIIPFRDRAELLDKCLSSILKHTSYNNYEIVAVNNGSVEKDTLNVIERYKYYNQKLRFVDYDIPFNYSRINNYAVENFANGEHIIFLNNDIEIATTEWIEELLMYSQQPDVGAVGCKLVYPNHTVQHAGLVITPDTAHGILSPFHGYPENSGSYGARLTISNNYSAVTAACLMLKREYFDEVGGFNEEDLKISYNDVDLCLKLVEKGYRNVYTPYCVNVHNESATRGYEDTLDKLKRCGQEQINLKRVHQEIFSETDPAFNKNLDHFSTAIRPSGENTMAREEFVGVPFFHNIHKNITFTKKGSKYVCIFSHFDKKQIIREYVVQYLKDLSAFSDIIFVSTSKDLPDTEIDKIKDYVSSVIIKDNIGYDFGAWKTGLTVLGDDLADYEYLIMCNDSVYGLLHDIYERLEEKMKYLDVLSVTDNYEIKRHLQSYFIVYGQKAINHEIFQSFWNSLRIIANKRQLVLTNEVEYTNKLINSTLKVDTLCPTDEFGGLNRLHYDWRNLILKDKCPFLKRELVHDNPRKSDLSGLKKLISTKTRYDYSLID